MTRIYPNTAVTRTGTFRNSSGVLTDPATIKFTYRIDRDQEIDITPVKDTTGVYKVTFSPNKGGTVRTRWQATSPDITLEDYFPVSESSFAEFQ